MTLGIPGVLRDFLRTLADEGDARVLQINSRAHRIKAQHFRQLSEAYEPLLIGTQRDLPSLLD